MKKGLLTTLLLASGAALAVYLLKEEQDKKAEPDDTKRMIKLRTDEEDKELMRTIQEIENLPMKELDLVENVEKEQLHVNHFNHEILDRTQKINTQIEDLPNKDETLLPNAFSETEESENFMDSLDDFLELDIPSFKTIEPVNSIKSNSSFINDLADLELLDINESTKDDMVNQDESTDDLLEEADELIEINQGFVKENFEEEPSEIVELDFESLNEKLPEEDVQEVKFDDVLFEETIDEEGLSEDELSKTAVFDFASLNENLMDTKPQEHQNVIFQDDDLEEIDLSSLFFENDSEVEEIIHPIDETAELKLVDIDEDEIKKLFLIDDEEELEEIIINDMPEVNESVSPELKKELTEEEFEEFKRRLIHVGEDDVDLIDFSDSKPFETTSQLTGEIDLINFGDVVEEPTVALEDLVLDKPIELFENNTDDELEEIVLEEINSEPIQTIETVREFPEAIYDISKLYPYLNLKFINAVFNNFSLFNEEFEIGSDTRIIHKVQFPESQNLISFIEIIKEYGYEINGTDENHNILIYLDFKNEESKILSEIYNISNQVNCLDGLYKGYELEHI